MGNVAKFCIGGWLYCGFVLVGLIEKPKKFEACVGVDDVPLHCSLFLKVPAPIIYFKYVQINKY